MEDDRTSGNTPIRFTLAPAFRFPRLAIYMLAFSVLLVLTWIEHGPGVPWELAAMIISMGLFPLLAFFALGMPTAKRLVEVLDDRLHLPVVGRAGQMLVVRYREIRTLYLRAGPRGFFLLETEYAQFQVPWSAFEQDDDAHRLYGAIRGRIEGLVPGASTKLESMDAANSNADAAYDRRPAVTLGLMSLLVLVYIAEHMFSTVAREYALLQMGTGARLLIRDGEFFRLATASFLHVSVLHLGIVLAFFYGFGQYVERLFGGRHLLLLVGTSMIVGNLASTFSSGFPVFCGAQTAVVALIGSVGFVSQRLGPALPHGFRPKFAWWLLSGMGLFVLHVFINEVDVSGELGGALAGVLVTALVLIGGEKTLPRTAVGLVTNLGVTGLALITLVGAVLTVQHWPHGSDDETRMVRHHLETSLSNHNGLNVLAWRIALDPDAPRERLELARTAIERAIERVRDDNVRAAFEDTHAMVLFRLGETEAALRREVSALELTESSELATQVARLGVEHGLVVALDDRPISPPTFELVHHERRGFGVAFGASTSTSAVTWYAAVEREGAVVGLFRLVIEPGADHGGPIWLEARNAPASWPDGATLRAIASAHRVASWKAWSADPRAITLPRGRENAVKTSP